MSTQEREAIVALQHGDIEALGTLVRLHQVAALRTAYALTRDRQMAEDVVADAFISAYRHIDRFDPRREFAPWFYRIVVNGGLMALRKARRAPPVTDAAIVGAGVDPAPGPEVDVMRDEFGRTLCDMVWRLPPKQRIVVALRYYHEMDERAIAATLGCPTGTVKWRLHAARKRLRSMLEQVAEIDRGYMPQRESY